jgi:hypothetical protein
MQRYWLFITLAIAGTALLMVGALLLVNGDSPPEAAAVVVPATEVSPASLPSPVVVQNGEAVQNGHVAASPTPILAVVDPALTPQPTAEPQATSTTPPPTSTPEPSPTPTPTLPQAINDIPLAEVAPMSPLVARTVQNIYETGQALGRNPNTFSKLGDSTILNPHFMGPFDEGAYNLGEFDTLQPAIDRFSGSFARHGVAARHGLHSWTVFDPLWADKDWCEPNEDILHCEIRLNNPSVLFVRLGSNDAGAPSGFRYNVREVIETSMALGVIPILGTKADRFEGDNTNNQIIRELAAEYNVPLWDFDLVAGTIDGRGLDTDNVHLIIDELPHDYTQPEAFQRGHAMQDLTALLALDQVRQIIERP